MFGRFHFLRLKKELLSSLALSSVLLAASLVIHFYLGTWATENAGNWVTDLVLDNIPVFEVNGLFVYGALALWACVGVILLRYPHKIPFVFDAISVFVLVRSVFITLTHLGPFPDHAIITPQYLVSKFAFGGDLFFSGHTGLPFLLALVFWDALYLRLFFIASSVGFGAVVLAGHLHYSIDVLAAFFITYTIYHIAEWLFVKDHRMFVG